jgi:Protein tyrosine and serine/threonine kinase
MADGSRVAVKRMSTLGEEPSAFFARLEKAAEVHHANLLDVIRALEQNGEFWVVSRLGTGVPLSVLLKAGRMRSGSAVAVGMGILSGLTALHQAGLWHGSVHARNVHVDMDGTVRLGDQCLSPAPAGQSAAALRASDVRAAGALICSMLRVPLENGPTAGQMQALKVASSPLGLAAKAIAGPPRKLPAGYEAAHASLTLWEAARKMATSRRQAQARQDLSAMVMAAMGGPRPTVVQAPGRQGTAGSRRVGARPASFAGAAPDSSPGGASTEAATESPAGARQLPAPPAPQRPGQPRVDEERQAGGQSAPKPAADPLRPAAARLPATVPSRMPAGRPAVTVRPVPPGALTSRMHRPVRSSMPWTALALLAASLLLGVCVLMAVASAVPAHRRPPAPARPTPTQVVPAPTAQIAPAPPPPAPRWFGDVPVTTPIVVVPAAPGSAPAAPSPGTAAPVAALADLPPASAGDVLAVTLDVAGCAAGSACTISVEVTLQPSPNRRSISWTLSSIDLCTGRAVPLAASTVAAQAGWTHVIGLSTVTLPASSAQVLVAITDTPARAASSLAAVGSNHCP